MTTDNDIFLERRGNVALITIYAERTRNSLDAVLAEKLRDICHQIDQDASYGAMVVRGAGGNFCSGANRNLLSSVAHNPTAAANYRELGMIYDAFVTVGAMAVPTIAAVSGAVVGAGFNLLLSTDLRIVAHDARIEAGFLRLGVLPGGGFGHLSMRAMGRQGAAAFGIFGEKLSGREAVEKGLAWKSVSADEVDDVALAYAHQVAQDPELAREAIRVFREVAGPPTATWPTALAAERSGQMWSLRRRVEIDESSRTMAEQE